MLRKGHEWKEITFFLFLFFPQQLLILSGVSSMYLDSTHQVQTIIKSCRVHIISFAHGPSVLYNHNLSFDHCDPDPI